MATLMEKKALTKEEMRDTEAAAEFLTIQPQTLRCWRANKRYGLPYVKVGRLVRYRLSDLEAFVERRTQSGGDVED